MQQRQPTYIFPSRERGDAAGFECAVEFGGAFDGVGESEDGEGGEGDVEGVGGEMQIHTVHDCRVDHDGISGPRRGGVDEGLVVGDEILTEIDGGDVHVFMLGYSGGLETEGCEDGRAAGIVEDAER